MYIKVAKVQLDLELEDQNATKNAAIKAAK